MVGRGFITYQPEAYLDLIRDRPQKSTRSLPRTSEGPTDCVHDVMKRHKDGGASVPKSWIRIWAAARCRLQDSKFSHVGVILRMVSSLGSNHQPQRNPIRHSMN